LRKAVISDETARELYGTETNAVGKTLRIGYNDYTVCGVIEEPSVIAGESFAEIIVPYTTQKHYRFEPGEIAFLGSFDIKFLVEDKAQAEALRAELVDIFNRFSNSNPDWEIDLNYLTLRSAMRQSKDLEGWDELFETLAGMLLIIGVFVLLLIPALNLSGMISSRMEMRKLEMGVRKSFGATRSSLLKQVIWENLVLTIAGGIVGIVLCWLIIFGFKEILFTAYAGEDTILRNEDISITAEMIFAPAVFLFSFVCCIVLNLMSAYIPAKRALRRPVVEMLNVKK
jgi:putative ABC transport system permease protein